MTALNIAVLGAGRMGLNLARVLSALGHRLWVSNGKPPDLLSVRLQGMSGFIAAVSSAEAVRAADIIFLAFMWINREDAIAAAGPKAFTGKIVVDLMNPYLPRQLVERTDGVESSDGSHVAVDLGQPSSGMVSALLPGARLVKAFNTLNWKFWEALGQANSAQGDDRIAVPVASDDAEAKALIMALVDEMGFAPLDAGSIADSYTRQEPGRLLYNRDWTGARAKDELLRLR